MPSRPLVRRQPRPDRARAYMVVDDLPRPVPVSRAELDVLEMYLGPALDALLREMAR